MPVGSVAITDTHSNTGVHLTEAGEEEDVSDTGNKQDINRIESKQNVTGVQKKRAFHKTILNVIGKIKPNKNKSNEDDVVRGSRLERTRARIERRSRRVKGGDGPNTEIYTVNNVDGGMKTTNIAMNNSIPVTLFPSDIAYDAMDNMKSQPVSSSDAKTNNVKSEPDPNSNPDTSTTSVTMKPKDSATNSEDTMKRNSNCSTKPGTHTSGEKSLDTHDTDRKPDLDLSVVSANKTNTVPSIQVNSSVSSNKSADVPKTELDLDQEETLNELESVLRKHSADSVFEDDKTEFVKEDQSLDSRHGTFITKSGQRSRRPLSAIVQQMQQHHKQQQQQQEQQQPQHEQHQQQEPRKGRPLPSPPPRRRKNMTILTSTPITNATSPPQTPDPESPLKGHRALSSPPGEFLSSFSSSTTPIASQESSESQPQKPRKKVPPPPPERTSKLQGVQEAAGKQKREQELNPLEHAATGALNSTGSSMHKGVKQEEDQQNQRQLLLSKDQQQQQIQTPHGQGSKEQQHQRQSSQHIQQLQPQHERQPSQTIQQHQRQSSVTVSQPSANVLLQQHQRHASQTSQQRSQEGKEEETEDQPLTCYNHVTTTPQRYCNVHCHAVCLECAFEFHRSCSDVELLTNAARSRKEELEVMCEQILFRKAEWECALDEIHKSKTRLAEDRERTLTTIQQLTDEAVKTVLAKGQELTREAESVYEKEGAESTRKEEALRHAVGVAQDVYAQGEELLGRRGDAAVLRSFGKLKDSCEAVLETDINQSADVLERILVSSTWSDDVKKVTLAELAVERRPALAKKNLHLSERGLETFRRISKRKRLGLSQETYKLAPPPIRYGPRSSMSRSIASTGSLPSMLSSHQSMGFLDGPQSMFEFWAGLKSDMYPFGLGDICVLQPRATILVTYLTSDLLRVFPWRQESPPFVSQPLGCTLCCITQLTTEIVAVTSSNSDQLSFMKLEDSSIILMHTLAMKKQYRAVTSLDYRTLALATDNKKSHINNVIAIVRFDSSDFRSYTHLKTIGSRVGSFPRIRIFSKTLFKVPYSMCVSTQGHIIVSDSENKALLALGQDGDTRFNFQPPKHSGVIDTPGGVACSPSGYLYLVDSCHQRILRFNSRGKLLKVVLSQEDGLEWPIGVACVDDSTICVAEFYGQVKVFQVR